MKIGRALVVIACLAGATRAPAQTIRPAEYLPLGQGAQWQFDRVAGDGPSDLHLEVTDVNMTDTGTRYFVNVPLEGANVGIRFEFATDGRLLLRALQADLNELLDDLPLDPSATADVQFSPPVLLGEASLVPGSAVVQTPIDTMFEAELQTNIGKIDLDVHTTGTITASWDSATSPTVTPAGSFPDVVTFVLDLSLRFFEDEFDTDGTVDERITMVLARGVGFVEVALGDTRYALVRAIVGGMPIGDFPQYEDIVGLAFTIPPVISLHGRALGEAAGGDFVLHDIRLSQTIYGKAQLDAVLDHPSAAGIPVSLSGKTKAKGDGRMKMVLEGKSAILDQKVTFDAEQLLDPASTTFNLTAKLAKTKTVIPIGIVPVVSGEVHVSFDGFVDQSAKEGSERKLSSNGRLRLGDVEYPILAKETLKVKKDGTHKRTYKFKPTNKDTVIVQVEAKSTSAADFTISKLTPKVFKWEVPKKKVSGITAEVVEP